MMTIHALGLHRQVRVWREDTALPAFDVAGTEECTIETTTPSCAPMGHIAVEAFLPRGPMVLYGALGAVFVPDVSTSHLRVRVRHLASDQMGLTYQSEFVVPPEEAHVGLPKEFVEAVVSGVNDQTIIGPDPGPGELIFDRATYGLVGSSEDMFRMLARAVIRLLAEPPDAAEEVIASALLEVLA